MSQTSSSPAAEDGGFTGRVLAERYRIESPIATGGMASVHVATDLASGRRVALKIMHPHLTRDRGFALRFKREAAIAGRLQHPSIVQVVDHGVDGHLFFLVMELLDGSDVWDVLRERQRLDEALARRVAIEVCDALAVAHAQGIVHRDLKPENVFLCRTPDDGVVVKVLDFGVAKMVLPDASETNPDDVDTALTAMGTLVGTPEYLSPEMCRGEAVGPAADLYACGVLLYALLTGRPPFVTERPIDVASKHISEEPLPPSWFVPGLDPRLDAIILRTLAKLPEDRPPSARALAEALLELGPTPPIPPSLLGRSLVRHAPDAPTLAVPSADAAKAWRAEVEARAAPAQGADVAEAREDAAWQSRAAPRERDNPVEPRSAPASLASRAAPSEHERVTFVPETARRPPVATSVGVVVIAVAVLVLTFAAGFGAGRMSAPSSSAPATTTARP